ncbi:3-ketoacyl-ACP reductase [Ancylobacter mangrovi]|uniref:3-ketoacyl-ACP reductase n=1 Tax=Ancylobacter mangrovi TaxID=2972472 RepID=UPI0021620F25|nr:3-ketoacyl-ACP reductase [Ancylobacter mangrovi]MCS0503350.1 3-ketoacyl-ACP reductase [Ancylobacter mangrovi]
MRDYAPPAAPDGRPVAFVTGSSRGIGRGIALALASKGFDIAVHGRSNLIEAQRTAEEVAALGGRVTALVGDIGDLSRHEAMLDQVETALGPLTTFVNNAGVGALKRGDVLEASVESYEHCMLYNAKAAFFLTQAVGRRLCSRPRDPSLYHSILLVSSVSAVAASTNRGEYCVSKAATAMIAQVFAARLAAEGIYVFDLQPGVIETDMSRPALADYQRRVDEEGLTLIPRLGQPADVGAVAASIASGGLPYVSGQVIRVDGAMLLPRL